MYVSVMHCRFLPHFLMMAVNETVKDQLCVNKIVVLSLGLEKHRKDLVRGSVS